MNVRIAAVIGFAALTACAVTPAPSTAPTAGVRAPARPSPVLLNVTAVGQAAEVRASLLAGTPVAPRAVSLRGVDVLLIPRNGGVGLAGRVSQSSLGANDLGSLEGGLVFGGTAVALEAAYVRRTGYSPATGLSHDSVHTFVRAGLRLRGLLGNTGGVLGFRAGYFLPQGDAGPLEKLQGWEGETTLTWTLTQFPLSAMLGYRLERFYVGGLEQEVSAVLLGAGLSLGARR